eukprot:748050-Hanusia_phi.AAC.5
MTVMTPGRRTQWCAAARPPSTAMMMTVMLSGPGPDPDPDSVRHCDGTEAGLQPAMIRLPRPGRVGEPVCPSVTL